MTSHKTIVVELGTSRIKIGFAGESKPRRVFNGKSAFDGSGTWTVDDVNDGMISGICKWPSFYQYVSSSSKTTTTSPTSTPTTTSSPIPNNIIVGSTAFSVYEWEKSLYPLFSHMLTSILFIQRPSRHRMLLLINDFFPPRFFSEALHRVLLDYLNVGGVWLVNGGVYEGLYHLLEGMPPPFIPSTGRAKAQAHLLVDIGTYEARVVASVAGSSTLGDTCQTTASGYKSFLCQVVANYQETDSEHEQTESKSPILSLDDADAVVQAWAALSFSSSFDFSPDSNTISVKLPSHAHQRQTDSDTETTVKLSSQPLMDAFHQIYLDYTNPSSLTFAMLTCVMKCPIDYRRAVLQRIILLGGGSVALRHFCLPQNVKSVGQSCQGFGRQLELSMRDACGISREKKENDSFNTSPIAQHHFQSLRGAVKGHANQNGGDIMGGINIQYPDPFAADLVAWIGGSVMGTLGYTHYQKKFQ